MPGASGCMRWPAACCICCCWAGQGPPDQLPCQPGGREVHDSSWQCASCSCTSTLGAGTAASAAGASGWAAATLLLLSPLAACSAAATCSTPSRPTARLFNRTLAVMLLGPADALLPQPPLLTVTLALMLVPLVAWAGMMKSPTSPGCPCRHDKRSGSVSDLMNACMRRLSHAASERSPPAANTHLHVQP